MIGFILKVLVLFAASAVESSGFGCQSILLSLWLWNRWNLCLIYPRQPGDPKMMATSYSTLEPACSVMLSPS